MIDIHTHVIPFVDDGSKSLETSIEMIKESVASGVTTIVATPHHYFKKYESSVEIIEKNFNLLKEQIETLNINVTLLLGEEIYYTDEEDIISMLKAKKLLTINGTKYVLIEFSTDKEVKDIVEVIYNFIVSGYTPIISHIERYGWMKLDTLKQLKKEGAILSLNSTSFTHSVSFKERVEVKKLLKLGLVDVIASDMHSFRRTTLAKAQKVVKDDQLFNFDLTK